jgi:hypothetical protein
MKIRRKAKRHHTSSTLPWHASISAEKTALNEKRTKARLVMCHCMEGSERVEVLSFTLSVNWRFQAAAIRGRLLMTSIS